MNYRTSGLSALAFLLFSAVSFAFAHADGIHTPHPTFPVIGPAVIAPVNNASFAASQSGPLGASAIAKSASTPASPWAPIGSFSLSKSSANAFGASAIAISKTAIPFPVIKPVIKPVPVPVPVPVSSPSAAVAAASGNQVAPVVTTEIPPPVTNNVGSAPPVVTTTVPPTVSVTPSAPPVTVTPAPTPSMPNIPNTGAAPMPRPPMPNLPRIPNTGAGGDAMTVILTLVGSAITATLAAYAARRSTSN